MFHPQPPFPSFSNNLRRAGSVASGQPTLANGFTWGCHRLVNPFHRCFGKFHHYCDKHLSIPIFTHIYASHVHDYNLYDATIKYWSKPSYKWYCHSVFFSCPQQLNRWPCHSLTDSLSHFYFWHYRVTLETCDLWDIWSEWWGNMTWPSLWQFFWQYWQVWTFFDNFQQF